MTVYFQKNSSLVKLSICKTRRVIKFFELEILVCLLFDYAPYTHALSFLKYILIVNVGTISFLSFSARGFVFIYLMLSQFLR